MIGAPPGHIALLPAPGDPLVFIPIRTVPSASFDGPESYGIQVQLTVQAAQEVEGDPLAAQEVEGEPRLHGHEIFF